MSRLALRATLLGLAVLVGYGPEVGGGVPKRLVIEEFGTVY